MKKTIAIGFIKKKRKKIFSSLNTSFVKDNKLFWNTVKPFFSNKGNLGHKTNRKKRVDTK